MRILPICVGLVLLLAACHKPAAPPVPPHDDGEATVRAVSTPVVDPLADSGSYVNMPVQCVGISTDLNGKPLNSCPSSNQKFARANPESWVRTCIIANLPEGTTTCTYATMVWQRFANNNEKIEVCGVAKTVGDPATGTGASCPREGSTTGFGSMKQVSSYDVAVVPPIPAENFTVTPTSGPAPLNVTLSWNVPNMPTGTPCQGQSTGLTSNAPGAFTGPKAAVGTEAISSLVESTRFTLTCVYSKDIAVVVSWVPPTLNMDGSPATDVNSFTVVYGQSPQELSQAANAAGNVTSLLVQDFYFKADQTWYFAVKANNAGGNSSDKSNMVSLKLVKPGDVTAPFSGSVTATVTGKIPQPPTNTSAQQVDAPRDTGQVTNPPTVKKQKMQVEK